MVSATNHTLEANGSLYSVVERGEGRDIVLYPSLGRAGSDFEKLAISLSDAGYRTFAVTPPGFVTPLGSPNWDSLISIAEELWILVEHLGIKNPVTVGHALGNRIMRMFSTLRPNDLDGIVLLACGGEIAPSGPVHEIFLRIFDPARSADARERDVAEVFFAPGNDVGEWRDGWNGSLAMLQGAAVRATDLNDFYQGGHAPGLVLQGLNDVIASPQNSINLVAKRPNTKLVNLDNCGHAMLPEQPSLITEEILRFVASIHP